MTAVYAVLTPVPDEVGYVFAIAADDTSARYVFEDGADSDDLGLDSARISRLRDWATTPPTDAAGWFALAAQSTGNSVFGPLVQADTLDDAVAQATEALKAVPAPTTASPSQILSRDDMLAFQRDAMDEWARQYPEAAAGDVDDPEADLALVHLMTPPVDPAKPHSWLPIATTEATCGFCDQPADAAIHTAGADTITRGHN